ncbi:MAG: HD-GYP domain-containing protein [Eubacteriales bacterium]|nr:HD-GYP domain-containing protein [Eubacteriales bacterium]
MSTGFATKTEKEDTLEKAEKDAEEWLHKKKLFEQKSYYSAILSSIMATMYARSQETEEHAQRLGDISLRIGERLGLPQNSLGELQIFSMLHDLGKVGIDDRILNKPGALSQEEWAVMKTHPEIGWQIAMSVPELECISDCILYHHEKWDGTGYPHGKQGEEIPLLSRILAVADAYDAMTENRIYRSAMSKKSAIAEIEINAGTQFDPAIVEIFLDLMSEDAS